MRIGELATNLGITPDTVRFYEREGLLPRARRRDNGYRDYTAAEVDHLRLLIDLRRLDVPLDEAARIAGWCHSGHCGETTEALPRLIADRRVAIRERIRGLQSLDARLASLERHLADGRPRLAVLDQGGPCCAAAGAVVDVAGSGCGCCGPDAAVN
jgi:DNA-binding transcriptional MerR regulator